MDTNKSIDIVILGGGLSGLNCGYELKKRGYNSFMILEASNRLGGRTETISFGDNRWIDMGGQWIGKSNPNLSKLINELNLKTYKQYYQGKTVIATDLSNHYEIDESDFKFQHFGIDNINYFINEIDSLMLKINFSNLNDINNDAQLITKFDSLSVHDWLYDKKNLKFMNDKVAIFFDWLTKMSIASSSKDISFLFFMKYIKSVGSLEGVFKSNDQTTEYERVIGGSQLISNTMGKYIGKNHIKLNSKVISVIQDNNITTIITDSNVKYTCKYVISTIPPIVLNNISFTPKLPSKKNNYIKSLCNGNTIKVVVVYKRAFWREKGYSGKIISFDGPIKDTFDNNTHDNKINSIVGFIVGSDEVSYWSNKSIDERKNAILEQYSKYWGEEALYPIYYNEKNWNKCEYFGGCFTSVCSPNLNFSTNSVDYSSSFGNIYFAGTETSNEYYGHMEGAILSSHIILNQILNRFNLNHKL